ncbi:MAG: hypothetical protein M1818_000392 [Claussenomyces sp. TS43310]|nr:MAG: hypothetical protein M1818_000392 [Claussenomyces sp. TS43310]
MFSKTFLALSSVLAAATASVLPLELRQNDICLPGEGVPTVFITNFVVINPVLINQFFDSNTVINIFGGDDITINNAPTYISTIVSATATTTSTVTATTTATATATATATTLPFVLGVEPVGVAKRQLSSSFIGGSGSTVGTCSSAVLFTIEAGQLFSGGEILSTTVSAQQQLFGVSSAGGSINTTFSAPSGSFLTWQNPAFTGGFAIFSAEAGSNFVNFNGAFPAGNHTNVVSRANDIGEQQLFYQRHLHLFRVINLIFDI